MTFKDACAIFDKENPNTKITKVTEEYKGKKYAVAYEQLKINGNYYLGKQIGYIELKQLENEN
jgi:hypothetical protein